MKANASPSSPQVTRPRIASIELFRIFAMLAIVTIHSQPFGFATFPALQHRIAGLINSSCRFSVPYFFMVSGYLFAEKISSAKPVMATFWRSARRLLSLYFVWCVFYLLVPFKFISDWPTQSWADLVLRHLRYFSERGLDVPFQGTQEVLWFLPSLVIGLAIVAISVANGWQKYLPYGAIALYTLGLAYGSYSLIWSDTGNANFIFNTRNGPFFSTLCVTFGWLLSVKRRQGKWQVSASRAAAIAIICLVVQIIETKVINSAARLPFEPFDYVVGTFGFGAGVLLLALAKPHWGENWPILHWSRYTLGIFLIHYAFIDVIQPLNARYNNVPWELGTPIAVYVASLATTALMMQWRPLRRLVS